LPLATHSNDKAGNRFLIETLNQEFTGKRFGVRFIDGEGETEDINVAIKCSNAGYYVVPPTALKKRDDWDPTLFDEFGEGLDLKDWNADRKAMSEKIEAERKAGASRAA